MRYIKFTLAFTMWFMSMFIFIPILIIIYIALLGEIETKGFWNYLKQGIGETWYCLVRDFISSPPLNKM